MVNQKDLGLSWLHQTNKGCVTLWPCHLHFKNILRQKKKNYEKLEYFTIQKYINFQKNPLKESKILQDIITL